MLGWASASAQAQAPKDELPKPQRWAAYLQCRARERYRAPFCPGLVVEDFWGLRRATRWLLCLRFGGSAGTTAWRRSAKNLEVHCLARGSPCRQAPRLSLLLSSLSCPLIAPGAPIRLHWMRPTTVQVVPRASRLHPLAASPSASSSSTIIPIRHSHPCIRPPSIAHCEAAVPSRNAAQQLLLLLRPAADPWCPALADKLAAPRPAQARPGGLSRIQFATLPPPSRALVGCLPPCACVRHAGSLALACPFGVSA